jgi:hypothetical protein
MLGRFVAAALKQPRPPSGELTKAALTAVPRLSRGKAWELFRVPGATQHEVLLR